MLFFKVSAERGEGSGEKLQRIEGNQGHLILFFLTLIKGIFACAMDVFSGYFFFFFFFFFFLNKKKLQILSRSLKDSKV